MKKKVLAVTLGIILAFASLTGCSSTSISETTDESNEAQEAAEGALEEATEGAAEDGYKIGYDVYWLGNTWSVMFAEEFKAAVEKEEYASKIAEVVYTYSDNDVNTQINNIEDMITQGCDAIIVTPCSNTALNSVLTKAREQGIKVILSAVYVDDDTAESYDALVYYDNYLAGKERMEWICEKLGYEGKVLEITGLAGYAANDDAIKAHAEVADQYDGIEIIGQIEGDWDYATTKTAMANALTAYGDFDAIVCTNGDSALAAIEAMEEANIPLVPISSEDNNGYYKKVAEIAEEQEAGNELYADFDTIAHAMPVYISVTALDTSLKLLDDEDLAFEKDYTYPKAVLEQGPGIITMDKMLELVKEDLPDGINTITNLTDDQLREIAEE